MFAQGPNERRPSDRRSSRRHRRVDGRPDAATMAPMPVSLVARRRTRDLLRRASIRVLDGVFEVARRVEEARASRAERGRPRGQLDVVARAHASERTSRPGDGIESVETSEPQALRLELERTETEEARPAAASEELRSLRLARHLHTLVYEEPLSLRRLVPHASPASSPTTPWQPTLLELEEALDACGRLEAILELFEHRSGDAGDRKLLKKLLRCHESLEALANEHRTARLLGPTLHAVLSPEQRAALEHFLEANEAQPERATKALCKRLERLDFERLGHRLDERAQQAAGPMTRLDYEAAADLGPAVLDRWTAVAACRTLSPASTETSRLRSSKEAIARLRHALEAIAPVLDPWVEGRRSTLERIEQNLTGLIGHDEIDERLGRVHAQLSQRGRTTLARGLEGLRDHLAGHRREHAAALERTLAPSLEPRAWAALARVGLDVSSSQTRSVDPRPRGHRRLPNS